MTPFDNNVPKSRCVLKHFHRGMPVIKLMSKNLRNLFFICINKVYFDDWHSPLEPGQWKISDENCLVALSIHLPVCAASIELLLCQTSSRDLVNCVYKSKCTSFTTLRRKTFQSSSNTNLVNWTFSRQYFSTN